MVLAEHPTVTAIHSFPGIACGNSTWGRAGEKSRIIRRSPCPVIAVALSLGILTTASMYDDSPLFQIGFSTRGTPRKTGKGQGLRRIVELRGDGAVELQRGSVPADEK